MGPASWNREPVSVRPVVGLFLEEMTLQNKTPRAKWKHPSSGKLLRLGKVRQFLRTSVSSLGKGGKNNYLVRGLRRWCLG